MTDLLHLTGIFDDVEDAIIKPGLIFKLDHYFIDHWLPLLGPNRAWLVVALQQACWRGRTPGSGAEISQTDLGKQCGLGRQRVNELLNHDPLLRWFVPAVQTQIKSGQQQNNRYQVWLASPPTPALVGGLYKEITERLNGSETLFHLVQSLTAEATTARTALLERLLCGNIREAPQAVADVVTAFADDAMDDTLRKAAKQLSRALLQPFRTRIETQYFRHNWLPILGPTAAWLVVVLRRGCYADENEVRNDFSIRKVDLSATLGVSTATLKRLLKNARLPDFFADSDWQPGRYELTGHIKMLDPLTPKDMAQAVALKQQQIGLFETESDAAGSTQDDGNPQNTTRQDAAEPTKYDTADSGNGQNTTRQDATERSKYDTVDVGNGQNTTRLDVGNGQNTTRLDVGNGQNTTRLDVGNGQNTTRLDVGNGQNTTRLDVGNGQNTTPCQHFKDSALLKQAPLKAVAALNAHVYVRKTAAAQPKRVDQLVDLTDHLLKLYREEIGQPTHLVKQQVKAAAIEIPNPALWDEAFAEMVAANASAWRYVLAIARRMYRDTRVTETQQVQAIQVEPLVPTPLSPAKQMWQKTLNRLQLQMTRATFGWFENSEISSTENGVWCVTVANDAAKEWLENRLYTTITRTAEDVAGQPVEIKFAVCQSPVPVQDTTI